MNRYQKLIAVVVAVTLVGLVGQTVSALDLGCLFGCSQCSQCGCEAECQKVCKKVCTTKIVKVTCWDVQCKDVCLAGKLDRSDCNTCTCGPEAPCGEVRTKKVLVKKTIEIEVPTVKYEIVECCSGCAGAVESEAAPEPAETPEPAVKEASKPGPYWQMSSKFKLNGSTARLTSFEK